MRIISGKARGIRLKTPKGYVTRPTSGRVKEAVFNIIQGSIANGRVLDLFAGTGALGLEALSRGAKHAVFVENYPPTAKVLKTNIENTKLIEKATIFRQDALSFVRNYEGDPFDLIFLDPPYQYDEIYLILDLLARRQLLSINGLIAWEIDKSTGIITHPDNFDLVRYKVYGNVGVMILKSTKGE